MGLKIFYFQKIEIFHIFLIRKKLFFHFRISRNLYKNSWNFQTFYKFLKNTINFFFVFFLLRCRGNMRNFVLMNEATIDQQLGHALAGFKHQILAHSEAMKGIDSIWKIKFLFQNSENIDRFFFINFKIFQILVGKITKKTQKFQIQISKK